MATRKLTVQEVSQIQDIPVLDNRKDAIQNLVIKEWASRGGNGVFEGFTSVGKSFSIAKVIKIVNAKLPEGKVCIVVPTDDLKEDFKALVKTFNLLNVDVFVVNSFAKSLVDNEKEVYYDLLICDELHTLCGEKSKYFSEVIPRVKRRYFFGVSATLEKEHVTYLKKYNLEIFFTVPLEDGYRTNIVPEYSIFNIPAKLTQKEAKDYFDLQRQYNSIVDSFTPANPHKPIDAINACIGSKEKKIKYGDKELYPKQHAEEIAEKLGMKVGTVIFLALKWQKLMTQRRMLLNNCHDSLLKTIALAKYINEPTVIVCSSIDVINVMLKHLPNSVPYHSLLTKNERKENKRKFEEGEAMFLLVAKGLKQGYNNSRLRFLIRQGYTSKPLDLTQYLGRLLRPDKFNPDKYAVLINVYVDDFMWMGKKVESQQKKWLISSLMNRAFVEWVNNINEIRLSL